MSKAKILTNSFLNLTNLCSDCKCNQRGSNGITCNSDFQCNCKTNYKNLTCDTCIDNHFDFPTCQSCQCNKFGSVSLQCSSNGKCNCYDGYNGQKCSECANEYNRTQSGECIQSGKFHFHLLFHNHFLDCLYVFVPLRI